MRLDANDTGLRTGLGRGEVEARYTAAELIERRQLEVELQADEDDDRRARREVGTCMRSVESGCVDA